MAAKFGKREKIVVGVLAGIATIAGVHFFVFQRPSQQLQALMWERDSLASRAQNIPQMPGDSFIEQFKEQAFEDEKLLFRVLVDTNLLPSPIFTAITPTPPPVPPPPAPEEERTLIQQYWNLYNIRTQAYQRAAEDLIAARFEQLVRMKRAYEAGQPWAGDLTEGEAGQAAETRPMRLSFLEGKTNDPFQDGWRLPMDLAPAFRDRPRLWDEISHLYNAWDVLNLIPITNPNYWASLQAYLTRLERVGMPNLPTLQYLQKEMGVEFPCVISMMMARLIWAQVPQGGTLPTVGINLPLSSDLLRQMFTFEVPGALNSTRMPPYHQLKTLNQQLVMLERALVSARRAGIEDVLKVKLPSTGKIVERVMDASMPQAAPPPLQSYESYDDFDEDAFGGGFYSIRPLEPTVQEIPKGFVALLTIRFRATSQNALRFLRDITGDRAYYRIEDISLMVDRDKVVVEVTLEGLMDIVGVSSLYAGLVNELTGAPKPQIFEDRNAGMEFWVENLERQKQAGLDEYKIIMDAFAKVGYRPDMTPESAPASVPVSLFDTDLFPVSPLLPDQPPAIETPAETDSGSAPEAVSPVAP